jgi:hypothetical protein
MFAEASRKMGIQKAEKGSLFRQLEEMGNIVRFFRISGGGTPATSKF